MLHDCIHQAHARDHFTLLMHTVNCNCVWGIDSYCDTDRLINLCSKIYPKCFFSAVMLALCYNVAMIISMHECFIYQTRILLIYVWLHMGFKIF